MKNQVLSALFALFSLSTFAQIPNYVPSNGLVGYWPFTGNANDLSGFGNNGTVNGATLTTDRFGNANQAYSFNGTSNYIDVNDAVQLRLSNTDYSISFWINVNAYSLGGGTAFVYKRSNGSQNGWGLGADQGTQDKLMMITSENTDPRAYSTSTLALNGWRFVSVTYSMLNQQIKFYINGVLDNTTSGVDFNYNPIAGMPSPSANCSSIMRFGQDTKNNSYWLNGKLDDIGVWNRAITQCEIKGLFNSAPWLAINDISICPNDTGTLIAQTVENGGAFQWSSGQQTPSINVSVPTTTSYSVAYTLNGLTCTDSAIVTVIPNQTAFFPSVNPICEGDPLSPLPTSSLNLFQGTWSPPLNNLLTTTYTFTPSPNVCVWDTTTLTIVVKPLPLLSSQDISVCKGQQVTVTSVPNIPNGAFAWSNNSTASQLNITADTSTFYTVSYTLDGCSSLVDTINVLVNTLPFVSITPNGPTTFCAESSINLSSLSTTGNLWSNGQNAQNITVSASGTYQLTVTDSNGCVDSASIFITNTGIACIQIGGVFTPNGDGTNDTWEIPGIENYPDATVEIFNRWGQQIFYSNGYYSPWNGTYNNERLPTGDYFYIIDLGDGNSLKGALTIKN